MPIDVDCHASPARLTAMARQMANVSRDDDDLDAFFDLSDSAERLPPLDQGMLWIIFRNYVA